MPKQVDHDARRAELAGAVWRVVRRDGVDGASVRATAREAGWSAGTVQHYFSTKAEMLAFAMEAMVDEGGRRLDAVADDGTLPPVARVLAALEGLAPLDPDAGVATELWIAFLARTLVDDRAREIITRGAHDLGAECRRLVVLLLGPDAAEARVDDEAVHLHALLDGLSVAAVSDPVRMGPERLRAVLRRHVEALAAVG